MNELKEKRFSEMLLGEVYFYTATIHKWHKLLKDDYKQYIVDSLKYLVDKQKIKVYAFVIMPNHVHFIWEMIAKNGKEMPSASFTKYTAHRFKEDLFATNKDALQMFEIEANNKDYQFWQRDSLPIHIYNRSICEQKLIYIHNNPLQEHWNLADRPEKYKWSSANFYETQQDEFGILTHYLEKF